VVGKDIISTSKYQYIFYSVALLIYINAIHDRIDDNVAWVAVLAPSGGGNRYNGP